MTQYSPLRIFFKTVVARAYPRVIATWRQVAWIFFDMAFPIVGSLAMVLVYQGLHAPRQYLGFVVMGGAMLAFWQNVLWSMATQFSWDRGNGTLELYTIAPTTFEAVLLGMAVGSMITTTIRAGVILVAGSLLFGISYASGGALAAIGVFLLTLAALYCLGMLLATALQEPVNFLSGLYFPVRALGSYVAGGASLVPMTLGLDAMRQLLLPGTPVFIPVGLETTIVAIQVPLYAVLAGVALRFLETRARSEGKLVTRWE
ncbi:MAG: ABC transporter permease [Chloroflexi bacterium]|nr:MAG: ABC transporter permease [Chloroflexota bacterium]